MAPKLLERNRKLVTQMDYFNRCFIHMREKKMAKQVKRPVGRSRKRPLELSEMQADKEKVQTHLT